MLSGPSYLAAWLLSPQAQALDSREGLQKLESQLGQLQKAMQQQSLQLQQDEHRGLHGRWVDVGIAAAKALHLLLQMVEAHSDKAGEVMMQCPPGS
jgi:hypothetical protein